jgi:Ca-activated chloride channel homolog
MQCQRVAAGIVLAAGLGLAQVASAPPAGAFRISADVERVVLPVTVVDRRDRIVPNLTRESFRVYDDGRLQAVHDFFYRDIPLTIGLVMDSSTSMLPKRASAILAALSFVRLSNPDDQAFVVNFNEKVSFGLSEKFSADPEQLGDAFLRLPCQGKTALYDAVVAAAERLSGGTRDKKALIVVSDGGDNASRHRLRDAMEALQRSEAIVYTIGLYDTDDQDRNPAVLKQLALPTGGEAFFPDSPRDLPGILARVARVLRSQYTITYEPAEAHDGRYHHIRVIATEPASGRRLAVRTRAGYQAPAPARASTGGSQ